MRPAVHCQDRDDVATPKSKSLLASLMIKPSYKVKHHQIIQIRDNLSLAPPPPPPPLQILTLQLRTALKGLFLMLQLCII